MDDKTILKQFYQAKTEPKMVDIPEFPFIMIYGKGNPNEPDGEYTKAVGLLYSLSYTIRMSPKSGTALRGYFEYKVSALEGLWNEPDYPETGSLNKDKLVWIAMIRQPQFVDQSIFDWACESVRQKKGMDSSIARLERYTEGQCVQCLHVGPYDAEPATFEKMERYIRDNGLEKQLIENQFHHREIYLSDPRRTVPEKLKTILRLSVRQVSD